MSLIGDCLSRHCNIVYVTLICVCVCHDSIEQRRAINTSGIDGFSWCLKRRYDYNKNDYRYD